MSGKSVRSWQLGLDSWANFIQKKSSSNIYQAVTIDGKGEFLQILRGGHRNNQKGDMTHRTE
jgi:hypothetical protein